jgi:type VI secretion system secreted protein VgrG
MPSQYTQNNRPMEVATPIPDLLLVGFTAKEGLSELFHLDIEAIAENSVVVDFDALLGEPIKLTVQTNVGVRCFHGICVAAGQGASDETFTTYHLEVVPKLWLLTKTFQSRIFQDVSVPEILEKVFGGLTVDYKVNGAHPTRNYTVQYRESDYDFAHRLMAEEGIYFFFATKAGEEKLIVTDAPLVDAAVAVNGCTLIYKSVQDDIEDDEDIVSSWLKRREVKSGKVSLWDYNFVKPHLALDSASKKSAFSKLEIYDYSEGDENKDHVERGDRIAKIRLEQEWARGTRCDGGSNCGQVAPGLKFTLKPKMPGGPHGEFFVTSVEHTVKMNGSYRSGEGVRFDYDNSFECIPFAVPFRTPPTTPKPIIAGTQTAVVVGPAGSEIYTDEHSRVKVHFFWDRLEKKEDAKSSCWIRVATPWAGKGWGMIHIPRVGQEVVVAFLEGDPDRPLIVGSVYNAEMVPPYPLPGNKTQSGIQTRSSLGGSPANFNQIRFEDKKGSELVTIHAEKDQAIGVEHDEAHWVGHDRTKTIDHDETTHVKHDRTETVDNNETITIHGKRTETVDKDETITIHANRTETVDKNENITIHGGRTETVDKDENITISGGRTETVAKDEHITINGGRTESVAKDESITISGGRTENVSKDESITIGGGRTENVAKDEGVTVGGGRTVSVGKDDSLTVGKNLTITAAESITLTTGSASIVMKKDGTITITGKDITVKGSGELIQKADKNVTIKGQKVLQN